MTQQPDTLIEFPCDFPIKVMGVMSETFAQDILALIRQHLPNFDGQSIEMRPSSKGNYLSLTCTVHVVSKRQLDDIYHALTSHPAVKVVL